MNHPTPHVKLKDTDSQAQPMHIDRLKRGNLTFE